MRKFYLSQNVARAVVSDDLTFVFPAAAYFSPTSSWWGVLAADSAAQIAALDAAVAKGLIEEISEADFEGFEVKKNKLMPPPSLLGSPRWQPPLEAMSPPRVVAPAVAAEPAPVAPLETAEAALTPRKATRK